MLDEYKCRICNDVWHYYRNDYSKDNPHDNICPHCGMPITKMWSEVYPEEGIKECIRLSVVRIKKIWK